MATQAFRALVAKVGAFYITDRAMKTAQKKMEAALAAGDVDERTKNAYLVQVKRYFEPFNREARSHLRTVDKRLEQLHQIQFNLTAERAVAVKRIDATQGVLEDVNHVAGA